MSASLAPESTAIPGCLVLRPDVRSDQRGSFVKLYLDSARGELGLGDLPRELYYSVSRKGVVRGLHLQLPPAEHDKLVFCLDGEVLDAVVDLRRGSPTFRQHLTVELSGERSAGVVIPAGCAHGFATTSEQATLLYLVTSEYDPDLDTGVRWDSAGIEWPVDDPIVSERDAELPTLPAFDSPFTYP